jgi:hypothetical protein
MSIGLVQRSRTFEQRLQKLHRRAWIGRDGLAVPTEARVGRERQEPRRRIYGALILRGGSCIHATILLPLSRGVSKATPQGARVSASLTKLVLAPALGAQQRVDSNAGDDVVVGMGVGGHHEVDGRTRQRRFERTERRQHLGLL